MCLQVDGIAIGFMSICKDVNVDLLNKCFELGPFHGLRVPHPDDVTQPLLTEPDIVLDDEEEEEEEEDDDDDNDEFDEGNSKIVKLYSINNKLFNGHCHLLLFFNTQFVSQRASGS